MSESLLTLWQRATARDARLSLGAKALAYALSSYMDATGGSCFPSVFRLAAHLNVSDRSVQRYREELERHGYLATALGGGTSTSRYEGRLPATDLSPVTRTVAIRDIAVTGPVTPLSPERSRDRSNDPSKGSEVDADASTSVAPTVQDRFREAS